MPYVFSVTNNLRVERGWEAAVYVVEEYAQAEARKTKFRMRTLCAVRQYVADGLETWGGLSGKTPERVVAKFWMEDDDWREKAAAYYEALSGRERAEMWDEEKRKLLGKLPQARE